MDKNTVIGFILIGLVLFTFSWLNRPTEEQKAAMEAQKLLRKYQDSIASAEHVRQPEIADGSALSNNTSSIELSDSAKSVQLLQQYGAFASAVEGNQEFVTLENENMEVRISSKGGRLCYARVKDYVTYDEQPLILFDEHDSDFNLTMITATNRVVNTSDLYFEPVKSGDNTVTMRLHIGNDSRLDFEYSLKPGDYMLNFSVRGTGLNGILSPNTNALDMNWRQKIRRLEKGRKDENEYTGLYYKFSADDVENLNQAKDTEEQLSNRLKWIGYKNKFFATVLIADETFAATRLQSKLLNENGYLKEFSTTTSVAFDLTENATVGFRYYIGPGKYKLLHAYDKGLSAGEELSLDELVPLGMRLFRPINKYFILPVFDFLGKYISSYGLVILLLTLIVKLCLFPLTYKSYLSTAKMRVLRPQVEEINARYPKQEQAMDRQKATMDLYSRAGASPMSGCLPMLLQMPILIALYWLFPTAIELRQESFLWAQDLSTYDAVISWDSNIPFITSFIGNHISLFCVLMTVVNVVYTKFNMNMTNTGQQQMPGMKMMMYIMPLMMFFLFNQKSAGLSYYFLISSLITILQTLSFRFLIDEDKLLLKLEENKKKPKKKSGFMQRLEEAQRKQQAQLKKQQDERARQQKQQRKK
ncbi:MAG: membrane protein insertase YidC [Tannerella sp.]|jgi:YidC/Oxa1 family membrane protein insertase|nr:membrane protein insertase YidC [Tannerella sp.]